MKTSGPLDELARVLQTLQAVMFCLPSTCLPKEEVLAVWPENPAVEPQRNYLRAHLECGRISESLDFFICTMDSMHVSVGRI